MPIVLILLPVRIDFAARITIITWDSSANSSSDRNGAGRRHSGQAGIDLLSASLHDNSAGEIYKSYSLIYQLTIDTGMNG